MAGEREVGPVDPQAATQAVSSPEAETKTEAGRKVVKLASFDLPCERLAHFALETRLGAGGMGEVYRANDLSLERPVAVKLLQGGIAADVQLRRRFLQEARAQARLSHPNVCHIYFTGEEGDRLFFAMELVDGESLQSRIDRDRKLPLDTAVSLIRQAALGLREAHRHGFTHRDVKPSNLMLDRNGVLKLVDFGLVKDTEAPASRPALTGEQTPTMFLGTPLYASPEQAKGHKIDFRSDIYSLGATLQHLVSGRPPFDGTTTLEIVAMHVGAPRPEVAPQRSGRSLLDALLDRMMAKQPDDRFQSYDELIQALEHVEQAVRRPAGVIARGFAALIDLILITLLTMPIGMLSRYLPITDVDDIAVPILGGVYSIYGHARWGRTLGKLALDLEVVTWGGGRRLGFRRATVRFLAQAAPLIIPLGLIKLFDMITNVPELLGFVALLPTAIMFVLVAIDPSRRAPWDRLAKSLVRHRH